MQLSNVTSHSRAMDVMAAQGQFLAHGPEPDRLEALLEVRNDAWTEADKRSNGSAVSTHARMSTIVGRSASTLCGIAMLPLAYASGDEDVETGLISVSSGGEMVARSYGAAQLMRDNPVMGGVVLATTILAACGAAYGLLRSSRSTYSPSAEFLVSLGETTMSTCQNLAFEIRDFGDVPFSCPLVPKLEAIDGWTDGLLDRVDHEIEDGTQAASLESLLECIDVDLKETDLRTLRERIEFRRGLLQRGESGLRSCKIQATREKFNRGAALAYRIDAKLKLAVDKITDEIGRQRGRNLPRVG